MSSWARWIAYLVLAALIVVTSCRALQGSEAEAVTLPAGATG